MPGLSLDLGLGLGSVSGGQTPLQISQAHFNGGVILGGLWNIEDETANKVEIIGGNTDATDGLSIGKRLDCRFANGSLDDYISSKDSTWNDDTVSTFGGTWTYSEGVMTAVNGANFGAAFDGVGLTAGDYFQVKYRIYDYASGGFQVRANTGEAGLTRSADGSYTDIIKPNGALLYMMGQGTFNGKVTDFEVRKIDGSHLISPVNGQRGTRNLNGGAFWWTSDGSDDGHSCDKPSNATYRLYIPINTTDTQATIFSDSAGTRYVGAFKDGDAGAVSASSGSPTYYVDNSLLSSPTLDNLHTAIADGSDHILVIRNVDFTSWDDFQVSLRASEALSARSGSIIMFPEASITTQIDADHYNLLASQIGAATI